MEKRVTESILDCPIYGASEVFCAHCGAGITRALSGGNRLFYRYACDAADFTNEEGNTRWRDCSSEPNSNIGLGIPVDLPAKEYMRRIMRAARVCHKRSPIAERVVETPFGKIVFNSRPLLVVSWKGGDA